MVRRGKKYYLMEKGGDDSNDMVKQAELFREYLCYFLEGQDRT